MAYAGRIKVPTSNGKIEKYAGHIAFFSLATKAIHIEALKELMANAFLSGLEDLHQEEKFLYICRYSENANMFMGSVNK